MDIDPELMIGGRRVFSDNAFVRLCPRVLQVLGDTWAEQGFPKPQPGDDGEAGYVFGFGQGVEVRVHPYRAGEEVQLDISSTPSVESVRLEELHDRLQGLDAGWTLSCPELDGSKRIHVTRRICREDLNPTQVAVLRDQIARARELAASFCASAPAETDECRDWHDRPGVRRNVDPMRPAFSSNWLAMDKGLRFRDEPTARAVAWMLRSAPLEEPHRQARHVVVLVIEQDDSGMETSRIKFSELKNTAAELERPQNTLPWQRPARGRFVGREFAKPQSRMAKPSCLSPRSFPRRCPASK